MKKSVQKLRTSLLNDEKENVLVFTFSVSFLIHSFMSNLKLGSLNINGARNHRKRAMFSELMRQKNTDVMFIKETQ